MLHYKLELPPEIDAQSQLHAQLYGTEKYSIYHNS